MALSATPFGSRLGYAMGDFDVAESYFFSTVLRDDGGLDVSFDSGAGKGSFVVTASALDGAKGMLGISQGAVLAFGDEIATGARVQKAVPPFLLSRKTFKSVRAKKTATWIKPSSESTELRLTGTGVVTIERDGKPYDVPCVRLAGDDFTLWVADDAEWPWVLRIAEGGGDNYWIALATGDDLSLSRIEELAEALDETEPAVTPVDAPKKKTHDAVDVLVKSSGPEKKLRDAVAECARRSDAASRDALIGALASDKFNVRNDARFALSKRAAEPGFAEAACAALEVALRDAPAFAPASNNAVSPDEMKQMTPALHIAAQLPYALHADHLAYEPLRALLRRMANEHASPYLRHAAQTVLTTNLDDREFTEALIATTDEATLAANVEFCRLYGRTLARFRDPADVAAKATALLDRLPPESASALFDAVLFGLRTDDARWLPILRDWSESLGDRRKEAAKMTLKRMRVT